jgi:hypothetical protein
MLLYRVCFKVGRLPALWNKTLNIRHWQFWPLVCTRVAFPRRSDGGEVRELWSPAQLNPAEITQKIEGGKVIRPPY